MANRSETTIAELTVDLFEPETGSPKGTLMFLHGAWVGGWIWEGFAPWFADQGYACYVPTWRGHYGSKPVADLGRVSMFDFLEDALAVARSVQPDAIIGESMGGLLAQKVAEAMPEIKACVLMNSAPAFMVPASPKLLRSQFKYFGDLIGKKPNKPNIADYKALILNNVDEPEATQFYQRICHESGRALMEMSMGKVKVDPQKVKVPMYVVIGHKDAIIPLKAHRKTAALYDAEVAEYPEMSHHTFSEEGWEKVAAETLSWIEKKIAAKVA
ncbi:MAG: alpha/beta hydrolase [Actinomycetota bacterium]